MKKIRTHRLGLALHKPPPQAADAHRADEARRRGEPVIAIKVPLVTSGPPAFAIIDFEDAKKITPYRWRLHKSGYAYRNFRRDGKVVSEWMQRVVMDQPANGALVVDHIDENRLDNRRENLRLLDRLTNGFRGTGPNYPQLRAEPERSVEADVQAYRSPLMRRMDARAEVGEW